MKRFLIRFFLIIVLGTLPFAKAEASELIQQIIGKVFIPAGDKYAFQSSGFVIQYGAKSFFITANHTIMKIEKEHGKNSLIFIQLPSIRKDLFKGRLLFAEPFEDSAVFILDDMIDGNFNISFESPLSLKKGDKLLFVGYSEHSYAQTAPESVITDFLSEATESFDLRIMHLPPNLRSDERLVFLCGRGIPSEGLSGSPVFRYGSDTLIGIVSGFGDDRKDQKISEFLGVNKYSVFFPLDKTMKKIKESK